MKMSTKGRYALRLMLELAKNYEQGYTSVREVAKEENISDKYLEQIIYYLHKAELVHSARGAFGGHKLNKAPEVCTIGEILRAVEGELAPAPCDFQDGECPRKAYCATSDVWYSINEAINNVIDNITLSQLLERQIAKEKACSR